MSTRYIVYFILSIISVYRVHADYSIIHFVLLQYIILCLGYTVSSGIITIEFIDCISIWDISTRYIVYIYFEYYLSLQLAVHSWEDLAATRDIYIYIYIN